MAAVSSVDDAGDEQQEQQQWTKHHLLVSVLLQLALVHIAYRIDRSKSAPYVSTAAWAILLGVTLGVLLLLVSKQHASSMGLDPQILFFGLLPPIILEAGFNTQRKGFFSNLWSILLLAIVGTLIATLVTAAGLVWFGHYIDAMTALSPAEALLYGALISAIDPVSTLVVLKKSHAPPLLFNLLFGESVLNDAVAIVLSGIFQRSVLAQDTTPLTWHSASELAGELVSIGVGSISLSAAISFASAFVLKRSDEALKQYPTYEISIILVSAYASYVAGESLELSGLLAVFSSGVFIRHYHVHSISEASAATFTHLLATLAFLAENFIYLYLGISVFAFSGSFEWDWRFIGVSFALCLVARALNTFPLCALANVCWRRTPIPWSYAVVIWFSGLRGSIAFALALGVCTASTHHGNVLRASTLFTVLSTTLLFGMTTSPLIRALQLGESHMFSHQQNDEADRSRDGVEDGEATALVVAPSTEHFEYGSVRELCEALDEKHLKPLFSEQGRRSN